MRVVEPMTLPSISGLLEQELATGIAVKAISRLALSGILGGMIGLERELKNRPAGLRTNMFICFGAALFTLLSSGLAAEKSDYTRIAAQIIPGIGFIGVLDSAYARIDHRPYDGGNHICGSVGGHGRGRRAVPYRSLCDRSRAAVAVRAGASRRNF